ncbi:MAG: KpsF/GutQ family sugar-phosphate isomerase, partial [Xanthobacteraceae bacterium]
MANRKPLSADPVPHDRAPIASAVRTLEAEFGGISALSAAMQDGLGAGFVAAVETIRNARGRV